jgi:hypothetical protein
MKLNWYSGRNFPNVIGWNTMTCSSASDKTYANHNPLIAVNVVSQNIAGELE